MSEIEIQNNDGTPVNSINIGQISAGAIAAISSSLQIKSVSAISYDDLRLTALLGTRHFQNSGSNAEGLEAVQEKWVEVKVGTGTWTAIGGDPTVTSNYTAISKPAVSASISLEARLNVPAGASTFGDYFVMLDLFYRTEA